MGFESGHIPLNTVHATVQKIDLFTVDLEGTHDLTEVLSEVRSAEVGGGRAAHRTQMGELLLLDRGRSEVAFALNRARLATESSSFRSRIAHTLEP